MWSQGVPAVTVLEFAQARVDRLRAAILACEGTKSTTFDGNSITYEDLDDRLKKAEAYLAKVSGSRPLTQDFYMEGGV